MTMPLRKNDADPQELTTADLAGAKNTAEVSQTEVEAGRMKPVRSDRLGTETNVDDERSNREAAETTALFPDDQLRDLQARWNDIQTGFVDEPRSAVERADSLVASTMQQLAEAFSKERSKLEQQWDRGDNISTEDLRVAFQRYRSFFRRLLSM
jgi:hypothetical protein